jgi:hypothetical protein
VDDSGNPIAGSMVHYNNARKTISDGHGHVRFTGPIVSSHIITAKDGTFAIAGLPASLYWLCANGVKPTHLRSCDWGAPTTSVDLTTAASATNVKLQVVDGVLLTFHVTDTAGKIKDSSTTAGPASPGNFRLFVMDAHRLMTAQPAGVAANIHQYTMAVPKTRNLRLLLDGTLNVLDASGAAIPQGKLSSAIAVNGQPVDVQLTVK